MRSDFSKKFSINNLMTLKSRLPPQKQLTGGRTQLRNVKCAKNIRNVASLGSFSVLELQQQIKYYNNLKCGKTLDIIRLNTHQGRNRCSLQVIKPRQTSGISNELCLKYVYLIENTKYASSHVNMLHFASKKKISINYHELRASAG